MFERASYGDQFSEESIKTLESLAEKYAMNALLKINKKAFELSKKDSKKIVHKFLKVLIISTSFDNFLFDLWFTLNQISILYLKDQKLLKKVV